MFFLNVVYYFQTERNVQEEILKKMDEAMDEKAEKLNKVLSDILTLTKGYYNNETFYQYMDYKYGSDLDYLIQYQNALQSLFSETNLYPYEIANILFYTNNDTLFNGSYVRRLDEIDYEELGEKLSYVNTQTILGETGISLRVAHENSKIPKVSGNRSLSIICVFNHYRQYNRYEKLLRIDIDINYLEDVLLETNLFENMFLTDSNENIVVAANGFTVNEEIQEFQENNYDNMVVLSRNLGNFPLTIHGIYDKNIISKEFKQGRTMSTSITIMCLFFSLLLVYVVVGSMNKRLNNLVKQSKEIAKGNFILNGQGSEGDDEFSILEKSINQMSTQLADFIDREYKAEIKRAEQEKESNQARLLALQSQVNPHFMFNALESIRLKAAVKGETETAAMIKYMARMFRKLIEWDKNIITLSEEIKFLDEFLHIQNYRFGDEFSYEIDVTDEAYRCLIPKMILQPLVENACVHGTEAVTDNRWIKINAEVKDGWLKLAVEDNGGGIVPEKLQELRDMLKGETNQGKSVGLWNVYRRLVLYYGENFMFDIKSVQGKGTWCIISIPANVENKI